MHETEFSFAHLESHPPGATIPAGRQYVGGWVMPKPGGHFVDVRARVGDRLFPGIHGFPRPDLAAHFSTGLANAFAEFRIAVTFAPGPAEVILEVLEIEGRWSEFLRVKFQVSADLTPIDAWAPAAPLRWHDFCRGLEAMLRRAGHEKSDAAWPGLAQAQAGDLPWPRDLLVPAEPFVGFSDEPAIVQAARFGRLPVLGYLFHRSATIKRLWATTDLQLLQSVPMNRSTPEVAARFPGVPGAATAGYHGLVDVPRQLPNPVRLRLFAETPDQNLHLVHAARVRVHDADADKFPFPAAAAAGFDAALAAWKSELARRSIPVIEDKDFIPGIDRLRRQVRGHGAATATPPASRVFRPASGAPARPSRALLVTHNLNPEGAPRFLLDLAAQLVANGTRVSVLSPEDGPLREDFAALGAGVAVVDTGPLFGATSPEAADAALLRIGSTFDFAQYDVVVCNTFTTFWGGHAAQAAGRPVLLYVHESTTPAAFYQDRVAPAIVRLAETALAGAEAISFTTEATRSYHLGFGDPSRHHVVPGWIDVARLDQWRATQDWPALRQRLGVREGEKLVTNIGTVSDRKGQHAFVRAVDLLARREPALAGAARFVLLGGRDTVFDQLLADLMAAAGRPNLVVHPETSDYLPYYATADLTVCSSYEESSPRVVLEAMALQVPLLSSAVHGVPELARDGLEATLVPAGDSAAWAEALARLLRSPEIGRDLAARARARVVAEFAAERVLPRHLALIARVAARAAR